MENKWNKAYQEGFTITTQKPSKVVSLVSERIKDNSTILDVGCGEGRNSLYFLYKGHRVFSTDIVDLGVLEKISKEYKERFKFYKKSVQQFEIKENFYDLIILSRLIQYLPEKDLEKLIENCKRGLKKEGILLISYNSIPTIKNNFDVSFYPHPIEKVKFLLEKNGIKVEYLQEGDKRSSNLPYDLPSKTYDIIGVNEALNVSK